ncbi:MAG: hypothetical protein M0Z41_18025 [Peptococcaceae bacterium]|jgi:hypothetical protein|nr:hypothetical protein [Peptococcaceae bacterium]
MVTKVTLNTAAALKGPGGETLRRSLAVMPGVKRVVTRPDRVEVHYDRRETGAGRLMTAIRAYGR